MHWINAGQNLLSVVRPSDVHRAGCVGGNIYLKWGSPLINRFRTPGTATLRIGIDFKIFCVCFGQRPLVYDLHAGSNQFKKQLPVSRITDAGKTNMSHSFTENHDSAHRDAVLVHPFSLYRIRPHRVGNDDNMLIALGGHHTSFTPIFGCWT